MQNDPLRVMLEQLGQLEAEGLALIHQAEDAQIEPLRVQLLSKKSKINDLMQCMSELEPQQRPQAGQALNQVKKALIQAFNQRLEQIALRERQRRLCEETIDVTLPGRPISIGSLHPLTRGAQEILDIFMEMGFETVTGPDLEDDFHNFEALNLQSDHPARDMHDTFYLSRGGLLRTHTSPVQIRTMRQRKPPLAIVAPGRVYRCDADQTHSPMFTQIEGLMVGEDIRMSDLKGVLERLIQRYFGQRAYRMRPSFFPFTEPSTEIDILWQENPETWLEVLGAGMVHPVVLENVGYDPRKVSGFAFGLGVERFVMLKHGMTNIRRFYENDLRFLRQFLALE